MELHTGLVQVADIPPVSSHGSIIIFCTTHQVVQWGRENNKFSYYSYEKPYEEVWAEVIITPRYAARC